LRAAPAGDRGVLLPWPLRGGGGVGDRCSARDGEVPHALCDASPAARARGDGGDEMTCTYAELDGAYVLGALCPSERADFENHMRTCDVCRESVAALAVLPGLLGRLSAETVEQFAPSTEAPVTAPTTLLPGLLTVATQRRRKERRN